MQRRFLERFSRITSSGSIIPEVEGLRFIAITTVVLHHLGGQLLRKDGKQFTCGPFVNVITDLVWKAGIAVQLFFGISAFILALRFARQRLAHGKQVSLKGYYLRRITRLEPPYIISLILTLPFAIAIALSKTASIGTSLIPHFLASATYTHGLFYRYPSSINGVSWSLEVEVQFYILAPLFGFVYTVRSAGTRYLIYLTTAAGAITWQHFNAAQGLALSLPSHLQFFVVGFFLADLYVHNWNSNPIRTRLGDLYSLVGWSLSIILLHYGNAFTLLLPLAIIIAYIGAFRGKWTSFILSNPYIVTIGGMCYTIYLYHFTLIIILSKLTFKLVHGKSFLINYFVQIMLLGSAVLIQAFCFFALFERPFMERNWPRRVGSRLRSMRR